MGATHLLRDAQDTTHQDGAHQPLTGTRRAALSKAKVGGHEGKSSGRMTCWKAVTTTAVFL
jgi:hypothetical protein